MVQSGDGDSPFLENNNTWSTITLTDSRIPIVQSQQKPEFPQLAPIQTIIRMTAEPSDRLTPYHRMEELNPKGILHSRRF